MTHYQGYLLVWTGSVVASAVGTIWLHRRLREAREVEALWYAATSALVGVLYLGEFGIRLGHAAISGKLFLGYHTFLLMLPTLGWILVAPWLLAWSFVRVPPWHRPRALLVVRLGHILVFALASWAAVLSLISV